MDFIWSSMDPSRDHMWSTMDIIISIIRCMDCIRSKDSIQSVIWLSMDFTWSSMDLI